MRGQGAVEYLIIVAAMMVIFATITVSSMTQPAESAAATSGQVAQARSAFDKISSAINGIYAGSEGAVWTEVVTLGSQWELEIDNNADYPWDMRLRIRTADGWESIEENLRYSFDNHDLDFKNKISPFGGTYAVIVEWSDNEGIDDGQIENDKIYIYINP